MPKLATMLVLTLAALTVATPTAGYILPAEASSAAFGTDADRAGLAVADDDMDEEENTSDDGMNETEMGDRMDENESMDGNTTDEDMSDGSMTETEMANDSMTETEMSDGMDGNESMDDNMTDDDMSNDSMTETEMNDGMSDEDSMTDTEMSDDSMTETDTEMMDDTTETGMAEGDMADEDGRGASIGAPGFGIVVALLAVLLVVGYGIRRRG